MIEIRIPKEIKEYKEKIMLGLTLRQVLSVAAMAIINVPAYILLNGSIGMQATSFVILLNAAPIALFGFVKIGGMNIEEFVKMFLISSFFYPLNRPYKTENLYEQISKIIRDKEYKDNAIQFEEILESTQKEEQKREKELRKQMKKQPKKPTKKSA